MPRRSRIHWPLWIGVVTFFLAITLYTLFPLLTAADVSGDPPPLPFRPLDEVRERGMAAIAGLWFFVFGASIGSFLNVVAHRMPVGLTIVSKPSRCPYCMTRIRFCHNIPILGWLALRGRCHTCRLPIAPRYPLVEWLVGVFFLTLFLALIASGGANLPLRTPNGRAGVIWNLYTPQWELIRIYFYHAFLLGMLTTIALIRLDRLAIPWRLVLFGWCVGAVSQMLWPALNPVPGFNNGPSWWTAESRFLDPLLGAVAGAFLGGLMRLVVGSRPFPAGGGCGGVITLSLVGLFLGWQSVVSVFVVAGMMLLLLFRWGRMRSSPLQRFWPASVLLATWIVVCFWRQLPLIWLPSFESHPGVLAAGAAFGLAIVYVASSLDDPQEDSPALPLAAEPGETGM